MPSFRLCSVQYSSLLGWKSTGNLNCFDYDIAEARRIFSIFRPILSAVFLFKFHSDFTSFLSCHDYQSSLLLSGISCVSASFRINLSKFYFVSFCCLVYSINTEHRNLLTYLFKRMRIVIINGFFSAFRHWQLTSYMRTFVKCGEIRRKYWTHSTRDKEIDEPCYIHLTAIYDEALFVGNRCCNCFSKKWLSHPLSDE